MADRCAPSAGSRPQAGASGPHRDGQGGYAVPEVPFVGMLVLLIVMAVLGAGRYEQARAQVNTAAAAAARAASLARSAPAAQQQAAQVVDATLAQDGPTCAGGAQLSVDLTQFQPGGQTRATITCQVSMSDLVLVGLPGALSVRATQASPIEQYKQAGP